MPRATPRTQRTRLISSLLGTKKRCFKEEPTYGRCGKASDTWQRVRVTSEAAWAVARAACPGRVKSEHLHASALPCQGGTVMCRDGGHENYGWHK
jgi:hypothetical protein